ncbi:MAG TPA: TIM barrel protein [Ktedonobacteraceae bacterium]|jgi:sugar phosphate isomerase/epimerase|nr:TIM barrel protein [Ktedonobacteraceae bacterium]
MTNALSSTALRLSVSTWSLHRTLGSADRYGPEHGLHIPAHTTGSDALPLLELPRRLAEFGIHTLEICYFHLPSLEREYLAELRAALEEAQVELFSLLIDNGDITHPVHAERDTAWISSWIDIAGLLGAKRARVIAGKAEPTMENIQTSVRTLRHFAERAEASNVRLMTENWYELLSRPEVVHTVFEQLEGHIGLCFDFGNWSGPTKYEDLAAIARYAESCHTKAHFDAGGVMDTADYLRCLDITRAAGFSGPYTLIYDGPSADEWAGLASEREIVTRYLH